MISTKDLKYLLQAEYGAHNFSTCSKRQYMAIILDEDGRLTGQGYNGSAPGQPHCLDGFCPRAQQGSAPGSNYDNCISIHAEANAIMYSGNRHTMYINGQSCASCAKLVAGAGIKRLVGIVDPSYAMSDEVNDMLRASGVQVDLVERSQLEIAQTLLFEKILR